MSFKCLPKPRWGKSTCLHDAMIALCILQSDPPGLSLVRGNKAFFMLNSAEHENLPANKLQITDKYRCLLAQFS